MSGFTLIELLVAIAIAGLLMAIAIPSYSWMISSNKVTTEAYDLFHDLEYARSESVKRGQNIVVCPSTNPTAASPACAAQANWETGWIVIVPSTGACTDTTGTSTLRIKQPFTSKDKVAFTPNTAGTQAICFNRMGFVPTTNTGLLAVNTNPVSAKLERCVAVSAVGHIQILTNTQKDVTGKQCT